MSHEQPASPASPAAAWPLGWPWPAERSAASRARRTATASAAAGRAGSFPVLFAVLMLSFALPRVWPTVELGDKQPFSTFWTEVEDGQVKSVTVNNETNNITGELTNGEKFTTTAPNSFPDADQAQSCRAKGVEFEAKTPSSNWCSSWASLLLPVLLIIGFFVWMQRRAAGPDGRRHVHRAQPGQGLHHRQADDDVRRRRRLRAA